MIDWINFTPLNSLLGGICIGVSAIIMLLTNGRIMGISGILGDLISFKESAICLESYICNRYFNRAFCIYFYVSRF